MKNSIYKPNSFLNILQGTMAAVSDRLKESGRWFLMMLLCCFLGIFGIHRFAAKRWGGGVLYLLTLGFLGIGVITDLLKLLMNKFPDSKKEPVLSGLNGRQRFAFFCLLLLGVQWISLYYMKIPFITQGLSLLEGLGDQIQIWLSSTASTLQSLMLKISNELNL